MNNFYIKSRIKILHCVHFLYFEYFVKLKINVILSFETLLLCGNRTEDRRIQTGICRSAQLLSLRSGRDFEAGARQPVYRSAALQEQERLGR